jgi:hypothetical protein
MPMPAYLRNGRFDILAANDLGRALYSPVYEQADAGEHPNSARFLFLDPAAAEFFLDHDNALNDCVAFLRAEAGRDPYDKELSELVGELSTRSEDFRRRWAAHDVRYHRTGRKRLHHRLVGDLELDYEAFELPGDPGQRINVYTAPPDSPAEQALGLLASWGTPAPAISRNEATTSSTIDTTPSERTTSGMPSLLCQPPTASRVQGWAKAEPSRSAEFELERRDQTSNKTTPNNADR